MPRPPAPGADAGPAADAPFDVERLRAEFPALRQEVHGRPLVYLDSAATALRPRTVLEAMRSVDERDAGNIHRGVHALGAAASERYEEARGRVARFLGAASPDEVIFTRGTTEAVNLAAATIGRARLAPGDEVLCPLSEHHANLVPWQMACRDRGAVLRPIPLESSGALDLRALDALLSPRTRVVALAHVGNVLGAVTPVAAVAERAHRAGALVFVDGAQAVPHLDVDVSALGCDLYAFSAHKVFGPTGVGALWGRAALLAELPPWQGGGGMIRTVSFDETTFAEPPARFEAGTPPIAAACGLGAALDWLAARRGAGWRAHEESLTARALEALARVPGLRLHGAAVGRAPLVAFTLDGVHPHDLATLLDQEGIAVRAGHHCAQPLHRHLGVTATTRASFSAYNTAAEIDALGEAVAGAARFFRRRTG